MATTEHQRAGPCHLLAAALDERVDGADPATVANTARVHLDRGEGWRAEKVNREPGDLEGGIAVVALDGPSRQPSQQPSVQHVGRPGTSGLIARDEIVARLLEKWRRYLLVSKGHGDSTSG
jgi:hypothetical protein